MDGFRWYYLEHSDYLMSIARKRAALAREEALTRIQLQVEEGTLIVRPMTDAEREFWGPPKKASRKQKLLWRRSLADPGWSELEDVA